MNLVINEHEIIKNNDTKSNDTVVDKNPKKYSSNDDISTSLKMGLQGLTSLIFF